MSITLNQKMKLDRSMLIKLGITFGIPFLIWLIPTNDLFTREMRLAIVFTVWMLAWAAFEISDVAVPALVWPALLTLTGVCAFNVAYSSYLSLAVPCCIGCLLLANLLSKIGLLKRIAFWIALRFGGTFNGAVFGIFFAALAVSVVTFASGCVITAALCYGMCRSLGVMKKKEGAIIMMAGMVGASTTRMFLYYPITMGAMLGSVNAVDPGFTFGFVELLKYNWPVLIYCLLFVWLMLLLGKTKNTDLGGGKDYFVTEYAKLGKMSREEKIGAVVVSLLMLWILTNPIHGLDAMYGFVILPAVFYLPGINIGTNQDIKDVSLGTILFFASCMAIGSVCGAVGITALITSLFGPLFANLGVVASLFTILTFGLFANLAMTPVAMLAGFTGMLYEIAINIGMNPLAAIFAFNQSTDMVFLPYEYMTFLIFFSFGCMTTGQFIKYQAAKNVLYYVFFGVVMIPYWYLVGLL